MKLKNLIALILCAVVLLTNVVPGTLAFGSDEETDGEPVTVIGEVAGDTVITVGSDEEQDDGDPAEPPTEDSDEPAAEPEQPADAETDDTEDADEPGIPEEPDDADDPADAEEPAEDETPEEPQASEPAERTLTANSVTVTGVLPGDTELVAERISDPLAAGAKSGAKGGAKSLSPAKADMLGLPAKSSGDVGFDYVDSLDDDWEAAAFYDIKLLKSGEALQPEETVTVTIENVPLKFMGPVSVKHFLDSEEAILAGIADGTVTAVKNAAYAAAFPAAAAAAAAATGCTGFVFVETITERDGLTVQGSTVSFPAKSFSIYAIGEGQEPSEYRLKVIFHRADGTTVSMLVKQDDIGMIDTVVYDPGEGTPPEGKVFRGWTTIENYNSATPVKDIDGIRAEIIALLNSGVTDMQTLDVYAMLFNGFTVTYLDESDVKINEISVFYTTGDSAEYTINQSYIPMNQDDNFRGWELESGTGISAYPTGKDYYPNGTTVTLTGNVVLKASIEEGHWIIFKENGKGASYTPPQFVRSLEVSAEPENEPTRPGYTFGGWYTNQACTDGNEFTFGEIIHAQVTLYAKWIAADEANYTVIVWKQSIDGGEEYDFAESMTFAGEVGAVIESITAVGTGNARHAEIDGTPINYIGFHLRDFDTDVTVVPEGTALVNVYYDRNVITLDFYVPSNTSTYVYTETTSDTGTQYGLVDGNYVQLTSTNGTWSYGYTGEPGYVSTTSTSNNFYQYGLVNGEYVRLTRRNNYGSYYWTYDTGEYIYTATTSTGNNVQQYGYVNGEYVLLTRHNSGSWLNPSYYWTYGNNVTYTGTRYTREPERITYTGTRYRYYDNAPLEYTGVRYTRASVNYSLQYHMSGLYGQTLTDQGYTWPMDYAWYDAVSGGTRITFMDAFLPSNDVSLLNFYGSTTQEGNRIIIFYTQDADLNGYTEANRISVNATGTLNFTITDKYNGYYAAQYRTGGTGNWTNLGPKNDDGEYATVSFSNTLEIRFNRLAASINFMDGGYFYRAVTPLDEQNRGQLYEVDNLTYGADLSTYNQGGANYYEPTYSGYILEGWYTDDQCSQQYTFTTMPEGGVTVYAKWVQKEYRVYLHPNVPEDEEVSWGDQTMCFRVADGALIYGGNMITGIRDDYELAGWYKDAALTDSFNFETELNELTVTTPYNKSVDMTDPIDDHGNLGATGQYNSDATGYNGGDRFWITKKLDLYALWRSILVGAKGITVEYDANNGTAVTTDPELYLDQARATAPAAPTPPAGSEYPFQYWVVQRWNGTSFVDTDTHVYANDTYTVTKSTTKEEDIPETEPGVTKKYTFRLKAYYGPDEEATPVTISYHSNGGTLPAGWTAPTGASATGSDGSYVITYTGIEINSTQTTLASDAFIMDGYTIVGWSLDPDATTAQFACGASIAADLLDPTGNILYAVWEEEQITLNYVAVGPDGTQYTADSDVGTLTLYTETIGKMTGTAAGSTASPVGDHRFIGWYSDAACTALMSSDAELSLTKPEGGWVAATYYAKFAFSTTTLTISKAGMGTGEGAIFTVTGPGYESGLKVAVPSGGSVTIANVYIGSTYTIVEEGGWSWRYTAQSTSSTLANSGNVCDVTNTSNGKNKWLSGSALAVNAASTPGT